MPMNLYILLHDDVDTFTNAKLIHDIKTKFAWASEYTIWEEALHWPRITEICLDKDDWRIRIDIRSGEDMSCDPARLAAKLSKQGPLPDNFLNYNIEIAVGFRDDPDTLYTDDTIMFGEFFRDTYPGIVIVDSKHNRW